MSETEGPLPCLCHVRVTASWNRNGAEPLMHRQWTVVQSRAHSGRNETDFMKFLNGVTDYSAQQAEDKLCRTVTSQALYPQ